MYRTFVKRLFSTKPSLIKGKDHIKIVWPTLQSSFHYSWLRDNCNCPECIHPSTLQKLHSSGQINPFITPTNIRDLPDSLEITWPDKNRKQHISRFSFSWLQRNRYDDPDYMKRLQQDEERNKTLWNKEIIENKKLWFSYKDFMSTEQNHLKTYQVLNTIDKYGFAFLRDIPKQAESVVSIAKHLSSIRETFYGVSFDVKSVPNAKNIAYTSLFLDLHMDLMYFEAPPGIQYLHCLESTVKGGESLFVDIFYAIDQLKRNHPDYYKILTEVPVKFHYKNNNHHLYFSRPTIIEPNKFNNFRLQAFYSPPFQAPLQISPALVTNFYQAFETFEKIIRDPQNLYQVKLGPGDCVIFANRRVLHGRTSFDSTAGERWLTGAYTDDDAFMDRLRVLKEIHEKK